MPTGRQLPRPLLVKGDGASSKVYIVTHGIEIADRPVTPTRKYLATDDFAQVARELGFVSSTSALAVKFGSIARHVDEYLNGLGHEADIAAIKGLLDDPEVAAWMAVLDGLALLPVKR